MVVSMYSEKSRKVVRTNQKRRNQKSCVNANNNNINGRINNVVGNKNNNNNNNNENYLNKNNNNNSTLLSPKHNQLSNSENSCVVCNKNNNSNYHQISANQINYNDLNNCSTIIPLSDDCNVLEASIINKRFGSMQSISLSPLKKYIRNNNNLEYMMSHDNNNNNMENYNNYNDKSNNNDINDDIYNNSSNNNNNNDNNNNSINNNNSDCKLVIDCIKDSNNNNLYDVTHNNNHTSSVSTSTSVFVSRKVFRFYTISKRQLNDSIKNLSNQLLNAMTIKNLKKKFTLEETNSKMNSSAAVLISLSILVLPFIPATNIFFYVGFVVAERILYLPSVGYCLLVGLGLGKLINSQINVDDDKSVRVRNCNSDGRRVGNNGKSIAAIVCLIVLISTFSFKTVIRNRDWYDEESLYRSAINVNPPKGKFTFL